MQVVIEGGEVGARWIKRSEGVGVACVPLGLDFFLVCFLEVYFYCLVAMSLLSLLV